MSICHFSVNSMSHKSSFGLQFEKLKNVVNATKTQHIVSHLTLQTIYIYFTSIQYRITLYLVFITTYSDSKLRKAYKPSQ